MILFIIVSLHKYLKPYKVCSNLISAIENHTVTQLKLIHYESMEKSKILVRNFLLAYSFDICISYVFLRFIHIESKELMLFATIVFVLGIFCLNEWEYYKAYTGKLIKALGSSFLILLFLYVLMSYLVGKQVHTKEFAWSVLTLSTYLGLLFSSTIVIFSLLPPFIGWLVVILARGMAKHSLKYENAYTISLNILSLIPLLFVIVVKNLPYIKSGFTSLNICLIP